MNYYHTAVEGILLTCTVTVREPAWTIIILL